jgi:hypothetical protein
MSGLIPQHLGEFFFKLNMFQRDLQSALVTRETLTKSYQGSEHFFAPCPKRHALHALFTSRRHQGLQIHFCTSAKIETC